MPTREEILACYAWERRNCFRCARANVDTAHVGWLKPRNSPRHELRACRGCVLLLEAERRRAAEQAGQEYKPGCLGESP